MKRKRNIRAGFSLVEVVLAMGVAAFCFLPLMALVPLGLDANRDADAQGRASSLLKAVAADLKATPLADTYGEVVQSPHFGFNVPDAGSTTLFVDENGSYTKALSNASRYRVTVTTVAQPATASDGSATLLRILISWPARAVQAGLGSLDTIVALDRN